MSARFCKGDVELAVIDLNEGVKEVGDSGALDAVCQGEVSFIDSFYTEVVSVLGAWSKYRVFSYSKKSARDWQSEIFTG